MKPQYYEIIACKSFGIAPEDMLLKSRKAKYVLPRQFCMKYRNEVLKLSWSVSAKRYNRNHSTALHGAKKIKHFVQNKDVYGKLYIEFLASCEKERENTPLFEAMEELLRKVEAIGLLGYVSLIRERIGALLTAVESNNESYVRKHIGACISELKDLRILYQIEM